MTRRWATGRKSPVRRRPVWAPLEVLGPAVRSEPRSARAWVRASVVRWAPRSAALPAALSAEPWDRRLGRRPLVGSMGNFVAYYIDGDKGYL